MTATFASFTAQFPEFANNPRYSEAQFDLWIGLAYDNLNARRLGSQLDTAASLWAAHFMTLSAREIAVANNGGVPGTPSGPVTAKGVDKVSASYAAELVADKEAGAWNLTTYGIMLWTILRATSTGPAYSPGPRRFFGPIFPIR